MGSKLYHLAFRRAPGSSVAGPSRARSPTPRLLDHWSGRSKELQEILAIFDGAEPLVAECSRPEEWTISVDDGERGWVIVSQLADPQWKARWIGLDGQGEYDGDILPAFRKGAEPGGWQRVEVPGPGRWTLRLEYDARDVAEGVAISTIAWVSWILVGGFGRDFEVCCGRFAPRQHQTEA